MKKNMYPIITLFSIALLSFQVSSKPVEWPTPSEDINTFEIAFSDIPHLSLKIPAKLSQSATILKTSANSISINFSEGSPLIVSSLDEEMTTGGISKSPIYASLGVDNLVDFFAALHDQTLASEEINMARQIMDVLIPDTSVTYKSEFAVAYWIKNADKNNQFLYILPLKQNIAIQIGGSLDSSKVETLLAALKHF